MARNHADAEHITRTLNPGNPLKKNSIHSFAPNLVRMLNVQAAAAYLGCTVWFVRTMGWEGKIPSVKLGNRLLFDREDLDAFITRMKAQCV